MGLSRKELYQLKLSSFSDRIIALANKWEVADMMHLDNDELLMLFRAASS